MEQLTDVWTRETPDEDFACEDLAAIAYLAQDGNRKLQNYLKKLWDGESWGSIKAKLEAGSSTWYVWWIDGVRQHLRNLITG